VGPPTAPPPPPPHPRPTPRGRTAASNYRVLEELAGGLASLVAWQLETGRTHQIRVHARHMGHPLLGDAAYGGNMGGLGGGGAVMQRWGPVLQGVAKQLGRPALHAKKLAFEHPTTGAEVRFDSELPDDLAAALTALRGGEGS
jgi:23S rRNA pseudouridine1911/1915/1917 synthase